ncbi:MAG: hypothetical protein LBF24_02810 [Puniceicoccales bacterium]|jgi:hypothetical protein|nr:hypothetical protein [Puniceicoccales bacterium]
MNFFLYVKIVERSRSVGFTLLEFLLALSLFVAAITTATSVFRRTGERFDGIARETVWALERARLIRQLEDDLLAVAADSVSQLPDGVLWDRKRLPFRCAYRLDRQSGRLHRLPLGLEDTATEAILDGRTVFLEDVAEFSLSRRKDEKFILLLRFSGENFTSLVPLGP